MLHTCEAQLPGLAFVIFQTLASSRFIFHDSSTCSSSVSQVTWCCSPTDGGRPALCPRVLPLYIFETRLLPFSSPDRSHWKGWDTRLPDPTVPTSCARALVLSWMQLTSVPFASPWALAVHPGVSLGSRQRCRPAEMNAEPHGLLWASPTSLLT